MGKTFVFLKIPFSDELSQLGSTCPEKSQRIFSEKQQRYKYFSGFLRKTFDFSWIFCSTTFNSKHGCRRKLSEKMSASLSNIKGTFPEKLPWEQKILEVLKLIFFALCSQRLRTLGKPKSEVLIKLNSVWPENILIAKKFQNSMCVFEVWLTKL